MLDMVTADDIDQLDAPLHAKILAWSVSLNIALSAVPIALIFTEWSLTGFEF